MKNSTYVIEKNFGELNCCELIEPEVNHVASDYLVDHYDALLKRIRCDVNVDPSKAEELLHDVYVSIATAENEGRGYDISHSNEGDIITVEGFVNGRIDRYAKNLKYSVDGTNRHIKRRTVGGETTAVTDFDIVYASPDFGDPDNMTGIQRAYMNAHSYDSEIESIEDEMSLRSSINFCLDFNDVVGFNLLNLFRNIDIFGQNVDKSIFDNLRSKMEYHDEFGEAMLNVLKCARDHRAIFESVLATF